MDFMSFLLPDDEEGRLCYQHCDFYDSLSTHPTPTLPPLSTPTQRPSSHDRLPGRVRPRLPP